MDWTFKKENILISVVIPLFYGKKYIPHLLEMFDKNRNILRENLEIILVNDSPQELISQMNINLSGTKVVIINNKGNRGIHASRVEGLKCAVGKYVLFMDQDDDIADNYLKCQLSCIKEADAVLCNGIKKGNQQEVIYQNNEVQDKVIQKEFFLTMGNEIVSPGQVLLRKDKVPDYWKTNIMIHNGSDDAFLWTLMLCSGAKFVSNYNILYTHNSGGANASLNYQEMADSVCEWQQMIAKCKFIDMGNKQLISALTGQLCKKLGEIKAKWDIAIEKIKQLINVRKYNNILIYGWGSRGRQLYNLLINNRVEVMCAIDIRAEELRNEECPVILPEEVKDEYGLMIISIKSDEGKAIKEFYLGLQNIAVYLLTELLEGT